MNIISSLRGEHLVKPVRLFGKKSTAFTQLKRLIAICLGICLLLSLTFALIYFYDGRRAYRETVCSGLDSAVDDTDAVLESIQQALTLVTSNRDIFGICYSAEPSTSAIDTCEIVLSSSVENSSYISDLLYYIPRHGLVITSSYRSYDFSACPDNEMITKFLSGEISSHYIETNGKVGYIFFYRGSIYIARRTVLNNDSALSVIFARIDTGNLCNALEKSEYYGSIWIYDQFYYPVLTDEYYYPAQSLGALEKLEATGKESIRFEGYRAFLRTSSISGWKLLYLIKAGSMTPTVLDAVLAVLPASILTLIISLMCALVFTQLSYKPFLGLFDDMEAGGIYPVLKSGEDNALTDEFAYLSRTMQDITERQKRLNSIINATRDDIVVRFFTNVLSGIPYSYNSALEVLGETQSAFQTNAPYAVCVLRRDDGIFSPADSDCKFITASADKFFSLSDTLSCTIADGNELRFVIMFSLDDNVLEIKQLIGNLEKALLSAAQRRNIPVSFASGQLYHSILDLSFSYRDALNALNSLSGKTPGTLPAQTVSEPDVSVGTDVPSADTSVSFSFPAKAQKLIELCTGDDKDSITIYFERIIDDICSMDCPVDEKTALCKEFISCVADATVRLEYVNLSSLPSQLFSFSAQDMEYSDSDTLRDDTCSVCADITREISGLYHRQQNRYLLAARDYIAENFRDYNISLSSVAEAIDANPSYLSKLFKANMGVYFTDYLNNFRLEHSMELLRETNMSVKEIADDSGFNSPQNYIRVFKKKMNITPGEYRKNERPGATEA